MTDEQFNESHVRMTYKLLAHEKETEIRLIDPKREKRPLNFFVHTEDEFVAKCKEWNGKYNVYVGINERTQNGTEDNDVVSVKTVVIDVDPVRPKKDNSPDASTDAELSDTTTVACQMQYDMILDHNFNPAMMMSGNGVQLWFFLEPIIITDVNRSQISKKIQDFNKYLQKYNTPKVKIDNIGNLSRVIKVAGTLSIKGSNTPERPWRVSCWKKDDYVRKNDAGFRDFILMFETQKETPLPTQVALDKISEAKWERLLAEDEKLKDLYEGKWEKHYPEKSRSEAEEGLVTKMVLYNIPEQQIRELMNTSKIGKWKEDGKAYQDITMRKAMEFATKNIVKLEENGMDIILTDDGIKVSFGINAVGIGEENNGNNDFLQKLKNYYNTFRIPEKMQDAFDIWNTIPIDKIKILIVGEEESYIFVIYNKNLRIPGDKIMSPEYFRQEFLKHMSVALPELSKQLWVLLLTKWKSSKAIFEKEVITREVLIKSTIINYISNCNIVEDKIMALNDGMMFIENDEIYIYHECLNRLLKRSGYDVSLRRVAEIMADYKVGTSKTITIGRKKEYFWVFDRTKFDINPFKKVGEEA